MPLKREQAVAALFARLSDPAGPLAPLIVTFSRAYKLPTEVQVEQQPALMLVTTEYAPFNPGSAMIKQRPVLIGHPLAQILHVNVVIYATQQAGDTNPEGNLLNPIIDAVESAIGFKPGTDPLDDRGQQNTNLGGLVESVSFGDTPIALMQGTGSLQATVIIPLEILITQGRTA